MLEYDRGLCRSVAKSSWRTKLAKSPSVAEIQATLLRLARPKMAGDVLLSEVKRLHPEASKKEIMRAAFATVIAVVDHDIDQALILQEFALKGRGGDGD
jgi:hypothetical protein